MGNDELALDVDEMNNEFKGQLTFFKNELAINSIAQLYIIQVRLVGAHVTNGTDRNNDADADDGDEIDESLENMDDVAEMSNDSLSFEVQNLGNSNCSLKMIP